MIKKLDKYIIGKFLGTFSFAVLLFIAIAVVVDISERIDDFIEHSIPFSMVLGKYYLNFIPYIVFLLSPLFIFLSVIFFTSQLAYRSEIVAMLAGGISFYRLLLGPYLVSSIILVAVQLYANHYLVPNANAERITFEENYLRKNKKSSSDKLHLQIAPEQYVYLDYYNIADSSGRDFTLELIEGRTLKEKLYAKKVRWEGKTGSWKLRDYKIRYIDGLDERIESGVEIDTVLMLKPDDLKDLMRFKEAMNTPELISFIAKEKMKGAPNIEFFEVEQHRRTSVPFATFILTIIGFSIASRKVRGGMGLHIFLGIFISAAFIVLLQFSMTFSTKGNLPPLLGAWVPNIVFGIVALLLVWKAQK